MATELALSVQKRFWAYAGSHYYPSQAGFDDFVGAFESVEGAVAAAKFAHDEIGTSIDENDPDRYAWWEVIEITAEGPKVLTDEIREKE